MQIFEIKNNTAEILYVPKENNLFLSDFLFIEDEHSTIVSQVTNISTTERADINIATVQFNLSVDKNNRLTQYDGHTPSKNADVGFLDANEIIGLFKPKFNAVYWGNYSKEENLPVLTDLKILSSGCAVLCEYKEQGIALVQTLSDSFKENHTRFLILDFEGKYKNIKEESSFVYGENYRIPLDSLALDYIFENDLNDCPTEAKTIIQGIILAIQKYIESVPDGFIPFETFLNIILSESKKSNSSGLKVFCNKLLKYKQKKIFADKKSHFAMINSSGNSVKIDVSMVDEKFYPLIFKSVINTIQKKFYVIADITEDNTTSSVLKFIYEKTNIRLIPILEYDNKNINKIKTYYNNLAIFSPSEKIKSEESYAPFLDKLKTEEFILWGENTLFVPIIVSLKDAFRRLKRKEVLETFDEVSAKDLDDLDRVNIMAVQEMMKKEKLEQKITIEDMDDLDELNNIQIKEELTEEEQQQQEISEEQEEKKTLNYEIVEETEEIPQQEIIQQTDNTEEELPVTEDNNANPQSTEEEIPEQNEQLTEEEEEEEKEQEQEQIQPEEEQQQEETEPQQEIPQEEKYVEIKAVTPKQKEIQNKNKNLPNPDELQIYQPKKNKKETNITFNEGDRVIHAKYGKGTIEKIINYGNKNLCSILFDTVGRRLLDPNITTIEKIV